MRARRSAARATGSLALVLPAVAWLALASSAHAQTQDDGLAFTPRERQQLARLERPADAPLAPAADRFHESDLGGAHRKLDADDPDGSKWLFKPDPTGVVAAAEVAANRAQKLLGLPASDLWLDTLSMPDGTVLSGSLQHFRPAPELGRAASEVWNDPARAPLVKELQKIAILDWAIGDHDGHGGNIVQRGPAQLEAIDHGQAGKFLAEDRLALDYNPNEGYETPEIQHVLSSWIRDGKAPLASLADPELVALLDRLEAIPARTWRAIWKPHADALEAETNGARRAKDTLDLFEARRQEARGDFARFYEQVAVARVQHLAADAAARGESLDDKTELASARAQLGLDAFEERLPPSYGVVATKVNGKIVETTGHGDASLRRAPGRGPAPGKAVSLEGKSEEEARAILEARFPPGRLEELAARAPRTLDGETPIFYRSVQRTEVEGLLRTGVMGSRALDPTSDGTAPDAAFWKRVKQDLLDRGVAPSTAAKIASPRTPGKVRAELLRKALPFEDLTLAHNDGGGALSDVSPLKSVSLGPGFGAGTDGFVAVVVDVHGRAAKTAQDSYDESEWLFFESIRADEVAAVLTPKQFDALMQANAAERNPSPEVVDRGALLGSLPGAQDPALAEFWTGAGFPSSWERHDPAANERLRVALLHYLETAPTTDAARAAAASIRSGKTTLSFFERSRDPGAVTVWPNAGDSFPQIASRVVGEAAVLGQEGLAADAAAIAHRIAFAAAKQVPDALVHLDGSSIPLSELRADPDRIALQVAASRGQASSLPAADRARIASVARAILEPTDSPASSSTPVVDPESDAALMARIRARGAAPASPGSSGPPAPREGISRLLGDKLAERASGDTAPAERGR